MNKQIIWAIFNGIAGSAVLGTVLTVGYQYMQASESRSIEFGRTQALLESRTKDLEHTLSERDDLRGQLSSVQLELAKTKAELDSAKTAAGYTQQSASENEVRLAALVKRNEELTHFIQSNRRCDPERAALLEIERRLDLPKMMSDSYRDDRRAEAIQERDQKYILLTDCLKSEAAQR